MGGAEIRAVEVIVAGFLWRTAVGEADSLKIDKSIFIFIDFHTKPLIAMASDVPMMGGCVFAILNQPRDCRDFCDIK